MMARRKTLLSILLCTGMAMLLVFGELGRAEVYRTERAIAFSQLAATQGFVPSGKALLVHTDDASFAINRFVTKAHYRDLVYAIESRMEGLFVRPLQSITPDVMRVIGDEFSLFFSLSDRVDVPENAGFHGDFLSTSIMIVDRQTSTEVTVTEKLEGTTISTRDLPIVQALHIADGDYLWSMREQDGTRESIVLLVETQFGLDRAASSRFRNLQGAGYSIADVSLSEHGLLINAVKGEIQLSAFFTFEADKGVIEVINLKSPASFRER